MPDPGLTIEQVFREESGKITASLIRLSGSFEWAEEAMQDAFASALVTWPKTGIPQNPAAWIMTTARNRLLDIPNAKLPNVRYLRIIDDSEDLRARLASSPTSPHHHHGVPARRRQLRATRST